MLLTTETSFILFPFTYSHFCCYAQASLSFLHSCCHVGLQKGGKRNPQPSREDAGTRVTEERSAGGVWVMFALGCFFPWVLATENCADNIEKPSRRHK